MNVITETVKPYEDGLGIYKTSYGDLWIMTDKKLIMLKECDIVPQIIDKPYEYMTPEEKSLFDIQSITSKLDKLKD